MPEKRPSPLLESPPDASSSDEEMEEVVEEEEEEEEVKAGENEEDIEEEEEEEEEEEGEDDEEEEEDDGDDSRFTVKKHVVPSPQPQSSSLGEEEEEESDSESGSDSDLPPENTKSTRAVNTVIDPSIKPITSIPMEGNAKHKKSTTEKHKPTVTPSKRPAKTDKQGDSKRRKKSGDGEESEKKSSNKLWSEDDEVAILKGMVSLMKKGAKPTSDMNALLEHIKASLTVDVTREQLHNKIRRLKQKYQGNAKREVKGEELQFPRTHESKCYELSKKLWDEKDATKVEGTEASNGGVDSVKKEGKSRSRKPTNAVFSPKSDTVVSPQIRNEVSTSTQQTPNFSPSPCFNEIIESGKNSIVPPEGLKGFLAKEALGLIGSSKAKALEEKWRKLQVAEAKIYLERIDLVREQVKLVLDALHSSEE